MATLVEASNQAFQAKQKNHQLCWWKFIRRLLQIGNEKTKEATTNEIKDYYDNNDFDKDDIYDIAIDTTKEDELFDYADIDKFYTKENSFSDLEREKYDKIYINIGGDLWNILLEVLHIFLIFLLIFQSIVKI